MTPLPVVWAASFLLVASGAAKIRHPAEAIPALRAVGLNAHRYAVVLLGAIEIVVGAGALSGISRGFYAAMAFLYIWFTVFSVRLAILRIPGMSCGCAGRRDLPPSWVHVVLNVAAVLSAVAASATDPVPRNSDLLMLSVGSLAIAWAAYLVVAYVPTLFSSYRSAQ
ncbi:MAG: hypothetical protein M3290_02755 [Actinomycetota bacterium]|nr:hypothetical protein [Actinomycetota bacterium]